MPWNESARGLEGALILQNQEQLRLIKKNRRRRRRRDLRTIFADFFRLKSRIRRLFQF